MRFSGRVDTCVYYDQKNNSSDSVAAAITAGWRPNPVNCPAFPAWIGSAMNHLVFDIETVPDVAGLRCLHGLDGLSDDEVVAAAKLLRRQKTGGSDFLPLHLQRVVAISVVFRSQDKLQVWSIGDEQSDEPELVQRFFDGIEKFSPTLVSWNGGGFDLPVLHYRAMLHKIVADRYWETGDSDNSFRWNNYINRYHERHSDIMDMVAMFQGRAVAPLDEVANLYGFPGKMGMSGAKVWDAFKDGEIAAIRNYCETDVLNTWLVYLRFELMRGHLDQPMYDSEIERVKQFLTQENKPHFEEFLNAWQQYA